MKSLCFSVFLCTLFLLPSCDNNTGYPEDILWYNHPASYWNSQALHLGNGFIGASFFGGVEEEVFAITEGSIWKGGPFNGSWEEYGINPLAGVYLDTIREAIQAGDIYLADSLTKKHFLGNNKNFGHFTSLGSIKLQLHEGKEEYSHYQRGLDLESSLGWVSYGLNGVQFRREYFCSYPDRVLAMNFSAEQPGNINLKLSAEIIQEQFRFLHEGNDFIINGLIDGNGRKFSIHLRLINYGGSIDKSEDGLSVSGADSVFALMSIATDYSLEYPAYRGDDPGPVCSNWIDSAELLGYDVLKKRHIEDYNELYSRVDLHLDKDLGQNKLPTDLRWENLRAGNPDPGLKELCFNLGKYMIISSSRPGSLPANLQGKWNAFYIPPWTGNYQANINIQEIYWPVGPMDLLECQEPYIEWTKDLVKTGREVAEKLYGTRGWVSHTIGNIYGHAAPVGGIPWGVYPLAPVWHCQHLWEQYNFSMDTGYLKETAFPIIREAAIFWLENLVPYDGYLVAVPSISAEHGTYLQADFLKRHYSENSLNRMVYTLPSSQDAQMISDLFRIFVKSARILDCDHELSDSITATSKKLLPHMIGKYGQLQEWCEDLDREGDHHRHISHLYALCPGVDIHPLTTPELAEAAKVSLNMRGDGRYLDFEIAAGGNWSRCWRIWCWARLMDGNRANKIFTEMLTEQGFENLLTFQHAEYDMGRPDFYTEPDGMFLHFQLDASASVPGFMAEMLVQSHLDQIILLPALPDEWNSGKITGLKTRGGHRINLSWEKGMLKDAVIYKSNASLPEIFLKTERLDIEKDKRIRLIN